MKSLRKANITSHKKKTHRKKTKVYKKIILKLSGEMLGSKGRLFDPAAIAYITDQLAAAHRAGTKIGVVVGAGNIVRGRDTEWLDTIDADLCGMMGTVINGIVLSSYLQKKGINSRLASGMEISSVVQRSNKFRDREFLDTGGILIFVAGTGNPLFTTDTAAALRAVEYGADVIIKATKVDGVYSADPMIHKKATFYPRLTYDQAIDQHLTVMDMAAFTICRDARIPICVYNLKKNALRDVVRGKSIGTLITQGGTCDR
jgi:uridylate kinase